MSEFQSSNALQNSVYSWTFNKSNRFSGGLYKKKFIDSIYNLPDKKNGRATTQGVGNRRDLRPQPGQSSPPPNTYRIKSSVDIMNLDKKKIYIGEKVPIPDHPSSKFPGPGAYDVIGNTWKLDAPVSIKSRIMFFYDEDLMKQKHCISPQKYLPSTKIVENLRFTKIGFGMGTRTANDITCIN
jgi:hypothetical protein